MRFTVGLALSVVTATALMAQTFELGKIEVTGQNEAGSNRSVEVIDAQTLQDAQSKNAVDALRNISGVYVQQTGAKGQQDIRIRSFTKSRVPIFVDGIPVYVPYNKDTDLSRFTTYDISEISVSKGYVSPAFGANTMGGAVNLITKKPTKEFEGEVGGGIFSGKGHEEFVTLGTKQEKFYGLVSVSNLQRDYFKLSSDYTPQGNETDRKRDNSDSKDRKLNIKVGYTPNDTDEYAFNYIAQRGEKGQPYYAGDNAPFVGGMMKNRNWQWPDWDKTSYYFITKTAIGEHAIKTRWYRDEFYNKMYDMGNLPASKYSTTPRETSEYDDHTHGGQIELDLKLADAHTLKLFASQKNDYHKDKKWTTIQNSPQIKVEAQTNSYGAEYSWKINDKLTWLLAGSWDKNEVKKAEYRNITETAIAGEHPKGDDSAFNPQTALYYTLSDNTMLYASISKKANMPTLAERYSTRFSTTLPNPDLKAESATTYEIGIEQRLWENHLLKSTVFLTNTEDYIAMVNLSGALRQSQNVGKERSKGIEMRLESQWLSNLSSTLSYAYIDAEIRNDIKNKYVTDTPEHSAFARLKYSPISTLDIIPQVRYESKRYASTDVAHSDYYNKAYVLADLKVAYRVMKDLEVAVGAKNLLDKNYSYSYGYPQEGRSYYANFRYKF